MAALEPSLAEAFTALLWLSLIHVPLYFALSVGSRPWAARAAMAGLLVAPTVIFAAIVFAGVTQWSIWSAVPGAAASGMQYVLALASLIVHVGVLVALLWPNQPLERTVPAV